MPEIDPDEMDIVDQKANKYREILRYYLQCVTHCIAAKLNDNPYFGQSLELMIQPDDNADKDSKEATRVLLRACALLQPRELLGKCIFCCPSLCKAYGNWFMKKEEAKKAKELESDLPSGDAWEVDVANDTYKVVKVMVFKLEWLQDNFIEPFVALAEQISDERKKVSPTKTQQTDNKSNEKDRKQNSKTCIVL